jgi:hypothetical protein
MKSSFHCLIPSLPFLLNHLELPSPELDPILHNNSLLKYTVSTEREREREERRRERSGGGSEGHYIRGGGGALNNITGFEGSQAVPACPSGIGSAY